MLTGRVLMFCLADSSGLFDDKVSAVGYTPGNAGELADRLEELVVDAARREAIAATARTAAIERFSPERMAQAFREAYAG